ncbi:MAG: hypothetical protein K9H48_07850 [Melioribacteraceae bacterium]|nr:hypothetical protein [Melioribacteraceae bacterium]
MSIYNSVTYKSESLPELGGFITSAKEFIQGNRKENPFGLFSEQIFGPKTSFKCSCGHLNSKLYNGQLCPKCKVYCCSNEIRYTQFGKIKMVFPIIKPTKKDELTKILGKKSKIITNPIRHELNIANKRYLALRYDKNDFYITDQIDQSIKNYLIVPFRITGIYSLYVVLNFCAEYLQVEKAKDLIENHLTYEVPVLPPNIRLFSIDDVKKTINTPAINKFYNNIIKINKINQSLKNHILEDEKEWCEDIRKALKEKNLNSDISVDVVFSYDEQSSIYQYFTNQIYDYVFSLLKGKEGLIRSSVLGKNIEFSARTVIISDPSLPAHTIKVSKNILKKLWMPYFLYYLTNIKEFDYSYCFDFLLINQENNPEFNNLFNEFLKWFCEK